MADSYSRNCKWCGRRIHMRKMPAGQWVAFEGYDTVHDCEERPSRLSTPGYGRQSHRGEYSQSPQGQQQSLLSTRRTLQQAGRQHRVAHLRYKDVSGRVTSRDVEVIWLGPRMCEAYCRLRKAVRHFRYDRVQAAVLKQEFFSPRYVPTTQAHTRPGHNVCR